MKKKLTRIVLTGGPCAGKTTALAKIVEKFSDMGYLVFVLPEAATLMHQAGVNFLTTDRSYYYNAEKALLKFQIEMENTFVQLLKSQEKPGLLICDRGVMDIAAYLDTESWQALTDELSYSNVKLRDERYDAVIHMVTAANGAEQFYSRENNVARTESVEQAIFIDNRLIQVWTGHPHLRIVGNEYGFEHKINKTIAEIADVLGEPEPLETERKYIVEVVGNIPNAIESEIYQTYLTTDDGSELRVRKRGSNGSYIYFLTSKKAVSDETRIETEKQITPEEYINFLQKADSNKQTIHKLRKCFVWERQYFELDNYLSPEIKFTIMEIEGFENHRDIKFPSFINVLEDVTGKAAYSNASLATNQ